MPCFNITVLCPPHPKKIVNDMNALYFLKYMYRFRAIYKRSVIASHTVYDIVLCDEDAALFLRDLPQPFIVASIVFTFSGEIFYKHAKIRREAVPPPHRDKILMDVYWNAIACEKNFKDLELVVLSQLPYPVCIKND
jgi:hypothetical protein